MTGDLAVVAGSCGPGNLHFINGLFDANRNRVPVLAIASHIPSAEIGSTYFQETHPQELFRECSVYTELVSDPAQLPWVLEIAMRTAVEKRGVAVVVVPGDVFFADAPDRRPTAPIRPTRSSVLPDAADVHAVAELLNRSKKVTILAGAGVAGAHDEVIALAEGAPAHFAYGLAQGHKHLPEIMLRAGLTRRPVFAPAVGRYAQGMMVQLPLQLEGRRLDDLRAALAAHYQGSRFVRVVDPQPRIVPTSLNNTNLLDLSVHGSDENGCAVLVAVLDNLGKGASGAAVPCGLPGRMSHHGSSNSARRYRAMVLKVWRTPPGGASLSASPSAPMAAVARVRP